MSSTVVAHSSVLSARRLFLVRLSLLSLSLSLFYAFSLPQPHAKGVCIANIRGRPCAIWFLSRDAIITTKSHCNRTARDAKRYKKQYEPTQTTVTNNIACGRGIDDSEISRKEQRNNEGGSQSTNFRIRKILKKFFLVSLLNIQSFEYLTNIIHSSWRFRS